ncbi:Dabb family protein [Oryzifoliimicrobium ureilyticus]|uniref:Dabb family protein n=1 Tax=Oryzifoliimicrobium ureilyticus TaxID=3113724 RepID=UPI0030765EE3
MILHCVFLRFKSALSADEKKELLEAVSGLKAKIPGIVSVSYGPNVSPEGLHGGFVDGFTVTFESVEARDAYLPHPDHVAVGERLVAATDGGLSGILVFDLEI